MSIYRTIYILLLISGGFLISLMMDPSCLKCFHNKTSCNYLTIPILVVWTIIAGSGLHLIYHNVGLILFKFTPCFKSKYLEEDEIFILMILEKDQKLTLEVSFTYIKTACAILGSLLITIFYHCRLEKISCYWPIILLGIILITLVLLFKKNFICCVIACILILAAAVYIVECKSGCFYLEQKSSQSHKKLTHGKKCFFDLFGLKNQSKYLIDFLRTGSGSKF